MSRRALKSGPQAPREYEDRRRKNMDVWYYEEPYGMTVVCGSNADCSMVVIPKQAILDYAKRVLGGRTNDA